MRAWDEIVRTRPADARTSLTIDLPDPGTIFRDDATSPPH